MKRYFELLPLDGLENFVMVTTKLKIENVWESLFQQSRNTGLEKTIKLKLQKTVTAADTQHCLTVVLQTLSIRGLMPQHDYTSSYTAALEGFVSKRLQWKPYYYAYVVCSNGLSVLPSKVCNFLTIIGPLGRRNVDRPAKRWADDIIKIAGRVWMNLARDREIWKEKEEAFIQTGSTYQEDN
ncbi:hypothetical protein EVAR_41477_1 [Eumeta japonica]|uniref:Uncharacterized protein n=1 Tax=Eumeta variegata TaxID=151549 RepID=A0A4C1WZN4_EUMVA|nr:hypothetical protein EVAR_41477_1 [Eumeta japonica]